MLLISQVIQVNCVFDSVAQSPYYLISSNGIASCLVAYNYSLPAASTLIMKGCSVEAALLGNGSQLCVLSPATEPCIDCGSLCNIHGSGTA